MWGWEKGNLQKENYTTLDRVTTNELYSYNNQGKLTRTQLIEITPSTGDTSISSSITYTYLSTDPLELLVMDSSTGEYANKNTSKEHRVYKTADSSQLIADTTWSSTSTNPYWSTMQYDEYGHRIDFHSQWSHITWNCIGAILCTLALDSTNPSHKETLIYDNAGNMLADTLWSQGLISSIQNYQWTSKQLTEVAYLSYTNGKLTFSDEDRFSYSGNKTSKETEVSNDSTGTTTTQTTYYPNGNFNDSIVTVVQDNKGTRRAIWKSTWRDSKTREDVYTYNGKQVHHFEYVYY